MLKTRIIGLVGWIAVSQLAGIIGSVFTFTAIPTWYETLIQPSFRPPNWLFAPVWTTLYLLMGIAAYRVWTHGVKKKKVREALIYFIAQLVFNALWSILFFGLRSPGAALMEIIVLWSLIIATMVRFYRIDRVAGYLFIPYSIWVTFASVLNASIWYLNR